MRSVVVIMVLVCGTSSCAEGPVASFERFFAASARGDGDSAWKALCESSRANLRALGADESSFSTILPRKTLRSVVVVRQDAEQAELEMEDLLGRAERIHMRKDQGHWCVDLGPSKGAP